jgi:hypothetical protein
VIVTIGSGEGRIIRAADSRLKEKTCVRQRSKSSEVPNFEDCEAMMGIGAINRQLGSAPNARPNYLAQRAVWSIHRLGATALRRTIPISWPAGVLAPCPWPA